MGLIIDFTGVSTGPEVIPEGTYNARVFEAELRTSVNSGSPYINWTFRIDGGEYDGRRLFFVTSLRKDALWNLKRTLKALRFEGNLDGQVDLGDLDNFLGRQCRIVVGVEAYMGEQRNRVLRVLPPDTDSNGGQVDPFSFLS